MKSHSVKVFSLIFCSFMFFVGCIDSKDEKKDTIQAFNIDFNWGDGGPNAFAAPGLWADANPAQHVKWYKDMGVNTIQTFIVSCNGYAWYKNGVVPEQPGLKYDFLRDMVTLGHKEGMKVMGYLCIGSNTRWGIENPDYSYGYPADRHIPYTKKYLRYLDAVIRDAVTTTGIDGFMIDWFYQPNRSSNNGKWLESEKNRFNELMGKSFPGEDQLSEEDYVDYSRKAISACWDVIYNAAKESNPNCKIWLTSFDITHPHIVNSKMFKQIDWLMNEAGDMEGVKAVKSMVGDQTELITCLAQWNGMDPKTVVPEALKAGVGLYGFTKPQSNSLLPDIKEYLSQPVDSFSGDAKNIAVLARTYTGKSMDYVQSNVVEKSNNNKLNAVGIKNVKLGGETGRRIDMMLKNNMLDLDVDVHLLNHFRNKKDEDGYVGLGKLLDAFICYSLYTKDTAVLSIKDYLVQTAIETQETDGYIGKVNQEKRMFGGATWDIHEMSYIIYSLSQNYRYFRHNKSLESAERAAQYIMLHWNEKPPGWQDKINVAETVAFTGWEEALVNLYDLTKNQKYLDFLLQERDLENWDLDIIIGRRPLIEGHIYSFFSRLLAQQKLYSLHPSPELLNQTEKAFDFLINKNGMTITGGAGQMEIWDDSQDGRSSLAESCATAYFMRICKQMIQLTGDSYYGDLMERTLYNSLMGAVSPDCSHTRYYTPFEGERVYSQYVSYCCNNNLRRILPAIPGMVLFTGENQLAVNLYTPMEANVQVMGKTVGVKQITEYPSSGNVIIQLNPKEEMEFGLLLRIPAWCKSPVVYVNGEKAISPVVPGQFYSVEREWSPGDKVELRLDMQPRLIAGVQKQAGRAALMRGPVLYCLNPVNAGELGELDGASLGHITLFPESIEVVDDNSVHPGGTALNVKIWKPEDYQTLPVNLVSVKLTEFTDPFGVASYFKLQDPKIAVPDELFNRTLNSF